VIFYLIPYLSSDDDSPPVEISSAKTIAFGVVENLDPIHAADIGQEDATMFKCALLSAGAMMIALTVPNNSVSTSGSWQVDAGRSDAQLGTDSTTDCGRTKLNVMLGFARLNGQVVIDNDDLAKFSFDFMFYPATSMAPVRQRSQPMAQHESSPSWLRTLLPGAQLR
jgi:hypothetical protein